MKTNVLWLWSHPGMPVELHRFKEFIIQRFGVLVAWVGVLSSSLQPQEYKPGINQLKLPFAHDCVQCSCLNSGGSHESPDNSTQPAQKELAMLSRFHQAERGGVLRGC